MKIITADQARALDPAIRLEADLQLLDKLIREAAEAGETKIRIPFNMCEFKGWSAKFKSPLLENTLVKAGYKLTTKSEDRQFVDLWIELSWADEG